MSPANHPAAGPAAGHTETFATAAAQHSEPAADNSEPRSDAGESAEPAETFSAEKEEVSQTAAQTAAAAAAAAVRAATPTVKAAAAADAAEATDSTEATKVVFAAAKQAAAADYTTATNPDTDQDTAEAAAGANTAEATGATAVATGQGRLLQNHLQHTDVGVSSSESYCRFCAQVSQAHLNQQSGSAPSFPLDLLKNNSTPTLVTDSNGNHFLIALTSHVAENQRTDAPGSKATNQITLQVHESRIRGKNKR